MFTIYMYSVYVYSIDIMLGTYIPYKTFNE